MSARLLLVDDNKHLRIMLSDHLTHEGYTVTAVADAESALELIAAGQQVDLVILDINMPGMGGIGFLRHILGADGKLTHPVIVLTARSQLNGFFDTVPVDGFVAKPCSAAELLQKIETVLAARMPSLPPQPDKKPLILIAEDDQVVRESIEHHMRTAGFKTAAAKSGSELLEVAARLNPSAIVIKQLLPGMNGTLIAPILATMPTTRKTPLLLYDDSRKFEDPGIFAARIPPSVSRFVASNRAGDLVREVAQMLSSPRQ